MGILYLINPECLLNLICLKQNTYDSIELYFEEKSQTSLFLEACLLKYIDKASSGHWLLKCSWMPCGNLKQLLSKGLSLPRQDKEEETAAWIFFWKTCHSLFMEQYFLIAVPLESKYTIALFIISTKRFVLTLLQGFWLFTSDIPWEKIFLDLPCSMF